MKKLYARLLAILAKQMMLIYLRAAIADEVRSQIAELPARQPARQPQAQIERRRFIGQ